MLMKFRRGERTFLHFGGRSVKVEAGNTSNSGGGTIRVGKQDFKKKLEGGNLPRRTQIGASRTHLSVNT